MGFMVGLPSLKLKNEGYNGANSGCFRKVVQEAIDRIGRDDDIDPSLSHLNVIRGIATTEGLVEYSRNHIGEMNKTRKSKIRSTAVVMCATIIKPPAAEMRKMSTDDQIRFMDTAIEEFSDIVGKEHVKTVVIHFDELGPHAHIFWEPMTADGRLCAKEVHNTNFFHTVNERIPKALRKEGFDVSDCNMYEKGAKKPAEDKERAGRSSMKYKRDMEEQKADLEQKIEEKMREYEETEQDLEKLKGKVLTAREVSQVQVKPDFWSKKDMAHASLEDWKNLITTALMIDEIKAENIEIIKMYAAKFEELQKAMEQAKKREKSADEREAEATEMIRSYEEKAGELSEKEQDFEAEKASFESWKMEEETIIHTAKDKAISEAEVARKCILGDAEKEKTVIIETAASRAQKLIDDAEGTIVVLDEKITSLEEKKAKLETDIEPLEKRARESHLLIEKAESESGQIKREAYKDGYSDGLDKGKGEYRELIATARNAKDVAVSEANKEKEGIIKAAEKTAAEVLVQAGADGMKIRNKASEAAGRIVGEANVEAQNIIENAKQIATKETEAKSFFDTIMSREGIGEFREYRRNPHFWLDAESIWTEDVPQLRKLVEELKGILSFIPPFVVEGAKKLFDYFGHERNDYEPYASIDDGSRHDNDGIEMESYISRGRSR